MATVGSSDPYKLTAIQKICVICIVSAVCLTVFIFEASRNDPGLRIAALVSATGIATALIAIPSVLLTGQNLIARSNGHDPADLPPGSELTNKETVKTPPIAVDPPPPEAE